MLLEYRKQTEPEKVAILGFTDAWGLNTESVEDVLRNTVAWDFRYDDAQAHGDLVVHFDPDISARALARCMTQIAERWRPSECRLLPTDPAAPNPPISILMWWD